MEEIKKIEVIILENINQTEKGLQINVNKAAKEITLLMLEDKLKDYEWMYSLTNGRAAPYYNVLRNKIEEIQTQIDKLR